MRFIASKCGPGLKAGYMALLKSMDKPQSPSSPLILLVAILLAEALEPERDMANFTPMGGKERMRGWRCTALMSSVEVTT